MANKPDDVTQEQIAAARLRVVLDDKLGRDTPDVIRHLAGAPSQTKQRTSSPLASSASAVTSDAGQDALTGLLTAASFDSAARSRLLHEARRGGITWLLLADIDWFKLVNNEAGHAVGDAVLRQIGALVRESAREDDLLGRFGGDEVVGVISRTRDEPNAGREIAERMRAAVASHDWSAMVGSTVRIRTSIGVATARSDEELDSLLLRADQLLYRAKEQGGDRVVVDQEEISTGTV